MNIYALIGAAVAGVWAYSKYENKISAYMQTVKDYFKPSPVPNMALKEANDAKDETAIKEETSEQLAKRTVKYSSIPKDQELTDAQLSARWLEWKKQQKKAKG